MDNKGKIEVTAVVGAVLLVTIVVFMAMFLTGQTGSGDQFNIQCLIGGGKECQAQSRVKKEVTKEVSLGLESSIACAYYRCVGNPSSKTSGCEFIKNFGAGFLKNCPCETIDKKENGGNGDGKVCDEESYRNPITFKAESVASDAKLDSIPLLKPENLRFDSMLVQDSCEFVDADSAKNTDRFIFSVGMELLMDQKNICEACECDYATRVGGNSVKSCAIKSNRNLETEEKSFYIYHESYRAKNFDEHKIALCSSKPAVFYKSGQPKGPVTLFEDKDFTGAFVDTENNLPFIPTSISQVKKTPFYSATSSIKLSQNYGITLYDDRHNSFKGGCRTFFESSDKEVNNLESFGFDDKPKSVKVWKNGFKGAILYESSKDLKKNNNEFYPNDGKKYNLKDTDCVGEEVGSVEVSKDSIVVLYDDNEISFVTSTTRNVPPNVKDKTNAIKVCPDERCLTSQERDKMQSAGKTQSDVTINLQDKIRCAYYRCAGGDSNVKACDFVQKTLGFTEETCPCNSIDSNKDGKVCGSESQSNPVSFRGDSLGVPGLQFVKISPIENPLNRMYVDDKCNVDWGFPNIRIDKRLLVTQKDDKDCQDTRASNLEKTECNLKQNAPIYIFHKKGELTQDNNQVILCSEKPS